MHIDHIAVYNTDMGFAYRLSELMGLGEPLIICPEHHPDGEPSSDLVCPKRLREQGGNILFLYRIFQRPDSPLINRFIAETTYATCLLRRYGANNVFNLFPYLVTGRGDHDPLTDDNPEVRKRDIGRQRTLEYLTSQLESAGANVILTINAHPGQLRCGGRTDEYGIPIVSFSIIPPFSNFLKGIVGDDLLVVSADEDYDNVGNKIAQEMGVPYELLLKKRLTERKVTTGGEINAGERRVVIGDDIGSTWETGRLIIRNTINHNGISVACIHPVFPEIGHNRIVRDLLLGQVNHLVTTNTVRPILEHPNVYVYDTVGFLAEEIQNCELQ